MLLYGVNDERTPDLLTFLEQIDITFPVILRNPPGYTLFGGLSPFPRDYIIDPEGVVQYVATEYRPTEMSTIIERLLPTVVDDETEKSTDPLLPRGFLLQQNFPNPFNPSTTIRFEIADGMVSGEVELSIFDMRGRKMKTLINEVMGEGLHAIHWDGTDETGNRLPSGTYLYSLKIGNEQSVRKMIMIR